MLQYKGYVGIAEVDDDAGMIFGRVVGLRDVITFQGETVGEARKAFEDSVDSYLALCASRGEAPEKPFSGKFLVRVPPELHRALSLAAEGQKMSLNALVQQLLAEGVAGHSPEEAPALAPGGPPAASRSGHQPRRKSTRAG